MSSLNIEGWAMIAFLFAYLLAIIFAITLHEFAHAFTAYKCGDMTSKLQGRLSINPAKHFDPFGTLMFLIIGFGWAKPVQINPLSFKNYKKGRILVSLAGVVTNLMLAFVSSGFYFFFSNFLLSSTNLFLNFLGYFFMLFMTINISLAFFNLLPIYPLDGFNFIDSFLRPGNKFSNFMHQYGSFVLLIFLITPLFDICYFYIFEMIQTGFFAFWGLFV